MGRIIGIVVIFFLTIKQIPCVSIRGQVDVLRTENEPRERNYCKSGCQKREQCFPNKYWAAASMRCELCSPLCDEAKARGSEDLCRRKCPKYCPRDTYWDDATRRCEQCGSLCDDDTARGEEARCLDKCPDYVRATFTAKIVASTAFQQNATQNGISPGVWVAITVIPFVVVFGIIVVVLLIWRKKRSHATRKKRLEKQCEHERQLLPDSKKTDATGGIVRQEQGPPASKLVPTGFKELQNAKAIVKFDR